MPLSDDFLNYVLDQLSSWGEVSIRRMFGGAGLYREGKMFGLIAEDVVYFKVDDSNREDYVKAGSAPFKPYPDLNKSTVMSYYEIPPEVLEDRDELGKWAQRSLEVQEKQKKKSAPRRRPKVHPQQTHISRKGIVQTENLNDHIKRIRRTPSHEKHPCLGGADGRTTADSF